jgi:parvulin-like peptidyl-prolyl isomerase
MTLLRRLFREPLVHFLLLGGLLFLYFEWRGSGGPGSSRIAITPGLVEHLASGFGRTWQRPPTDAELKGLIDDYVKEEIATREAVAMGLDRDDTIIRRRLRQKLEFLVEDAAASAPPTDAELKAWLEAHPQAFRAEPQLAFRQVYVSPERRGASAGQDAERLLARLRARGAAAGTAGLGDASMLPAEMALSPLREVSRDFGEAFAQELMKIEPGQWTGPVESPYGLHLVLVGERVAGAAPGLAEIRPQVERDLIAERRKKDLDTLYERLLAKYTVTIEKAKPPVAAAAGAGGAR